MPIGINNRYLEEKSKLSFYYNSGSGEVHSRTLAFLENIDVKESVTTNYVDYTPIGSNGSFFVYMGAKSRRLDLTFNLTLPLIEEYIGVRDEESNTESSVTKDSYFNQEQSDANINDYYHNNFSVINDYDNQHLNLLNNDELGLLREVAEAQGYQNEFDYIGYDNNSSRRRSLYKVMYCVNLIRTSTMTHSKKPFLGPPLTKLTHGILYQEVPCIVESYSIAHDPKAGYDNNTLLPRVLNVKMSLKEVRLKNKYFDPVKGDGDFMPGWDSIIEDKFTTIDPTLTNTPLT